MSDSSMVAQCGRYSSLEAQATCRAVADPRTSAAIARLEVPVPAEVLPRVGDAGRILEGGFGRLTPWPQVVLPHPDPAAGSDQPRRCPVEMLAPVPLRVEERAVVGEHILVDEDVALLRHVRPEIEHAVVETALEIHVEEGEDHRLFVPRQRVGEEALDERAAINGAMAPDVLLDPLEIRTEEALGVRIAVLVAGVRG